MPGTRISSLTALSGANSANDDDILIFDTDANTTKRISRSQLAAGLQGDLAVQYFVGTLTSDPTQRLDGSSLQEGDAYYNTVSDKYGVYDGAAWVNIDNVISARDAAVAAQAAAETAETNAETAETNAAASAAAAAASYDSFDDAYLGAKSSEPSVDNDGDALATGALFFDTTAGVLKVWDGAAWQSATTFVADNSVTLAKWSHGTQGGIPYYASTGTPTELAAGTDGLPLVTNGAGADPAYEELTSTGLADEAVTNAKLAHMATNTIKGRTTAGTGDVEDLTAAQVITILQSSGLMATARAKIANNGSASITESVGVTSINRTGTGIIAVTLDTTLSSSDYTIHAMAVNFDAFVNITAQSTTGFTIRTDNSGGAATDMDFFFVVHGTPA